MRLIHLGGILALLALLVPASPAQAGGVVSVCDEAQLREVLAGGGTVTFECSGTISLTSTIFITVDTTIDGTGQDVAISGNNAVRMFRVISGDRLILNRLALVDGSSSGYPGGGGVYNQGMLTISNSTFSGNLADRGCGGAIFNDWNSTLTISNSLFSDNTVTYTREFYRGGGVICNLGGGTVAITNSTFSGNSSTGEAGGGSIFNDGTLSVNNSVFSENIAENGKGGGIKDLGLLTVSNSTFSDNIAGSDGGGIYSESFDTLTIRNSTFSGNNAYRGGGIDSESYGSVQVSNSTFSGNSALFGGGIYNGNRGVLVVSNSTFSDNRAYNSGGGIHHDGSQGAISTLKNTLVANSLISSNCSGVIADGGGNLSFSDTTCPGINGDPILGPLQDNGGPTWTMALGWSSAAIDAGNDAICAADPVSGLDQRGVTRPQGAHCDIGAVEQTLDPTAVSLGGLSAQNAPEALPPLGVTAVLVTALAAIGMYRRSR